MNLKGGHLEHRFSVYDSNLRIRCVSVFIYCWVSIVGMIEFITRVGKRNKMRNEVNGIYLSKALTCMNFFLYKQKNVVFFIKETHTFDHIVV